MRGEGYRSRDGVMKRGVCMCVRVCVCVCVCMFVRVCVWFV